MMVRIMKASMLLGCALVLTAAGSMPGACAAGVGASPAIRVVVDPRVELVSIVFRLAGNPEYNQAAIPSYAADVDTFFGKFKDHPAVKMARRLREERGIGFNAPMALAVCVTDVSSLAERVSLDPRPAEMDRRWTPEDARAFVAELRTFVRDTRFDAFLASHTAFYQAAQNRLEDVLKQQDIVGWFDEFFGTRDSLASSGSRASLRSTDFIAVLGLLTGTHSYGASIRLANGSRETYSILNILDVDDKGIPTFDMRIVFSMVHEFCHAYMNPLVDAHEAELEAAGQKMFPFVEKPMQDQAYGNWKTMLYESLVRAAGVRFTNAHWGAKAAGREIAYNQSRQFIWTGELAELLGDYESNRVAYPTLDAFFPRITAFFNDYSGRVGREIEKLAEQQRAKMAELAAKGPKVVSMNPPNGSGDVDPGLSLITITFDRPMMEGNMALMNLDAAPFPNLAGDVRYDSTRTILRIPVKLEPGKDYGFSMNSPGQLVMCDDERNPLVPTEYRFRTRK
jgi:hypothetical protein